MTSEEIVAIECPYCRTQIIQPLSWFKQTFATCPTCEGGISAGQFAPLVEELEQAFDASIDEMVLGSSATGGCASGGCGGGSCSRH